MDFDTPLTGARIRAADPFSFSAEEDKARAQEKSCNVLKEYFDYIELALFTHSQLVDVTEMRAVLLEVSAFIQSARSQLLSDGYNRLLNRLIHIYAKGLHDPENQAYKATAADYADILHVVSQAHQGYDYSESVGQLLFYMDQLFKNRENSWIQVFDRLLKLSDSNQLTRELISQHLQEIQGWVEEGVENLFQLRDDQQQLIKELDQEIQQLEIEIQQKQDHFDTPSHVHKGKNVVDIRRPLRHREIQLLNDDLDVLRGERKSKEQVISLLDENISEFEEKLGHTRRRYLIHSV
jgi:hypothetical protein